jgi:transcriptional regulator with XRE-family HTH domain
MNKTDFIEWLEIVLHEQKMSKADLARATGISASHITRIMNGDQSPGINNIVLIARAIKKRPEEVFRKIAGISDPVYVPIFDEWNDVFYELTREDQEEILEIARMKANRKKHPEKQILKQTSRMRNPARIAEKEK